MADKTRIIFKGADLDYSNNEFVATAFHHHLLDESISLGTNVTFTDPCRSAYTYKVGAPADKLLDLTYIYASHFSADTIIDGAIEGQVIPDMFFYSSVTSSSYIYLSQAYVHVFRRNSDGTETDIVPEMGILSSPVTTYGKSTTYHKLLPILWTYDVDSHVMPSTSLLCMTVKLYGYLSGTASMYPMLKNDPSAGSLRISLPVVEGA